MQVNYYYRPHQPNNLSIENVFDRVIKNLPASITTTSYYAKRAIDFAFLCEIRKHKADIFHVTGAAHYAALALPQARTVLTIHDSGHLTKTLAGIRQVTYRKLFWDWPINRIKGITTISDFTRADLFKRYNLNHKLVRTIPNPVSEDFFFQPNARHERPVILQVGQGANKNIECLMEAVAGLPCKLLLVRPPEPHLVARLNAMGIDAEFRHQLTTKQLVAAYHESDILFFASTFEGFGLPIIEAMACGRPVITSRLGSMPEVAGDAAHLVDPTQPREVRHAISAMWSSPDLYAEWVAKGLQRTKLFAAQRIAQEYVSFYHDLIKQ